MQTRSDCSLLTSTNPGMKDFTKTMQQALVTVCPFIIMIIVHKMDY